MVCVHQCTTTNPRDNVLPSLQTPGGALVADTSRPLANLRWDDVRLFLALCRARTVASAAGTLGVDASTASRRLAALEEELGAVLFDRNREGITPTEAAENLMPVAEEIEAGMMRFANAAQGLEREASGLLRVACAPDVAVVLLLPLFKELLVRHPALRIEVEESTTPLDLTRREADLAVRVVRPVRGDLVVTRLMQARWVLAASPELTASVGKLRSWGDVPWISWTESHAHAPQPRWLAKHAREIEPIFRTDSFAVQLAAAAAGLGVVLVPEPSAAHHGLERVRLAPALKEAAEDWPVSDLFLVAHRALREVPRVRVVWDLLVERLGASDRGGNR
jgi:DNA-binding transcriptional LysR family regulator